MRTFATFLLLFLLLIVAFLVDIFWGSVSIPYNEFGTILFHPHSAKPEWVYIVWEMRIPAAITALLVGASLSSSGLVMQTLFRNPLADAGILGVSGGAGLGVALFMMGGTLWGQIPSITSSIEMGGIIFFAIAGAVLVLALIAAVSYTTSDITRVLIVGVMLSFLTGSVVSLLQYFAPSELVKGFQVWSFGSLEGSTSRSALLLSLIVIPALLLISFFPKALNTMLLGDAYARSLGTSTKRMRRFLILLTGIITGTVTAFVGPIAFIGIAVPHLVKSIAKTSNHRQLIPLSLLGGSVLMLLCHIVSHLPQGGLILPINVVTSVVGAPIVIAVILKRTSPRNLLHR